MLAELRGGSLDSLLRFRHSGRCSLVVCYPCVCWCNAALISTAAALALALAATAFVGIAVAVAVAVVMAVPVVAAAFDLVNLCVFVLTLLPAA